MVISKAIVVNDTHNIRNQVHLGVFDLHYLKRNYNWSGRQLLIRSIPTKFCSWSQETCVIIDISLWLCITETVSTSDRLKWQTEEHHSSIVVTDY